MLTRLISQSKRLASFSSMTVPIKVHYPNGESKLFRVCQDSTTKDFANLLIREDGDQSIQLILGTTDCMRNDIPFLDLILHNPTNLIIDGVTHAVEIDPCGPANYILTNSGLEKKLSDLEVPYQDAQVILKFQESLNSTLDKIFENKQSYSQAEVQKAIYETLKNFGDTNATNTEYWLTYQTILQRLMDDLEQKQIKILEVQKEAKNAGYWLLKKWIIISLIQYFILLYLTYGLYDWGVSEPISYLWAQILETIGLMYFLRRGFAFRQSQLFSQRFDEVFKRTINKKFNSSNFLKEAQHARNQVIIARSKLRYGITSR